MAIFYNVGNRKNDYGIENKSTIKCIVCVANIPITFGNPEIEHFQPIMEIFERNCCNSIFSF